VADRLGDGNISSHERVMKRHRTATFSQQRRSCSGIGALDTVHILVDTSTPWVMSVRSGELVAAGKGDPIDKNAGAILGVQALLPVIWPVAFPLPPARPELALAFSFMPKLCRSFEW
jgi:hypothetical protein